MDRNLSRSIRTKLVGAFFVPVVLLVLLGILSYRKASQGLIQNYESATITALGSATNYLNFGFDSVRSKATMLNSNKTLVQYYSGTFADEPMVEQKQYVALQSVISANVLQESYVGNIYLYSKYGKGFGITADGTGSQTFYDNYLKSEEGQAFVASNLKTSWSGYHRFLDENMQANAGSYGMSFTSYLYNSASKPAGFIVIEVSDDLIHKALDKSNLGKEGYLAFVTADGKEIRRDTMKQTYSFLKSSYYKRAQTGSQTEGHSYIREGQKEYLFAYSKAGDNQSMVCSLIPKDAIIRQASEMKRLTIGIVLFASLIALGIGTRMAGGISSEIQNTNQTLTHMASGDLTVSMHSRRKDEFHSLSLNINHMVDSMQQLIRNVTQVSSTVAHSAGRVAYTSNDLYESTKKIAYAVGDIEMGITVQAEDAGQCLLEMTKLSERIGEIARTAQEIGSIAQGTQQMVNSGVTIVGGLKETASDTAAITRVVIQNTSSLAQESHSIGNFINLIDEIARQTNLLSLNASIEAAHAGEAGQGFAVVAGEIRTLAEQVTGAAKQIQSSVLQIQDKTERTVAVAKQAEEIVASQGVALLDTVTLFTEINERVDELISNLKYVLTGVVEITRAKEDTLGAVESISAVAQETASAANELRTIMEEQQKAAEYLKDAAATIHADSRKLEDSVCIFRIDDDQ